MTSNPFELSLTVRCGTLKRSIPMVEVARRFGCSLSLARQNFVALLFRYPQGVDNSQDPHEGEPTEGEERSNVGTNVRNVKNKYISLNVSEDVLKERGVGRESIEGSLRPLAYRLAEALDDWKSLHFFQKLVISHSEALLEEALRLAVAVPAHRVKKTRGAYFTAVLRSLICTAGQETDHEESDPS